VDSAEECFKLDSNGWKGSAILRVAVGDSESKMPFSTKFGASMDEVKIIAKRCQVPITGVSFHVGSGCDSAEQYRVAIKYCVKDIFPILEAYGHQSTTLDIGGGFSSNMSEFIKVADVISKTIQESVSNNINVIAEPGRYLAQPCQDLFVKIIAKKPGLYGRGWRYVMDESLYSHFSCIPFDHQRPAWLHIPSEERAGLEEKQEGILFGRTCDSLDVIAKGMMEPMEVGDWLYFPLMGAYTSATASEFNGFPKPVTIVDNGFYLPDVDMAWNLVERIHTVKPLTYSNALPALSHMQPLPLNARFTT
jgi:ornithine decarboxylase